jgi:two-component system chemotaxis sensor kinase CheA
MNTESNYALLDDPGMKEILDSFLIETKEILDKLDSDLITIEKNPDDVELLNQIFRHFHTIKGTSGFFGLEKLPAVTHKCEDILNKLRKGEAKIDLFIMDGILTAYDIIKSLIYKIEVEHNENCEINAAMEVLTNVLDVLAGNKTEPVHQPVTEIIEPGTPDENKIQDNKSTEKSVEKTTDKTVDKTIRVDIERLDELLNITSELVLGRNRLTQVNAEASLDYEGTKLSRDLLDATKQIDYMINELQLVVMKTRMIKIGKIFNRFPRLVRDLSKDSGKEVNLIIKGEDTELDKTLIEEINDPLVHLIRNSLDHGVETPDERARKGKEITGTILLSAEQEGNNIVITIQDDGKGIDPDVIKEKAVEKGLISREKLKEMSRQDILNLIFLPGFSTKEVVTNISGRGVGMDVVKTNVSKLRGIINLESTPGLGTTIKIKLPLTLAIIPGMIVRSGKEKIVVPLNSIIEVLSVTPGDIYSINQNPVIRLRNEILPLIDIDDIVYKKQNGEKADKQYVVVIGIAEKKFGIKVDELIGQKEIVIKSLGTYLGNIPGIAGSTILGDGTVIMILDIGEIINSVLEKVA